MPWVGGYLLGDSTKMLWFFDIELYKITKWCRGRGDFLPLVGRFSPGNGPKSPGFRPKSPKNTPVSPGFCPVSLDFCPMFC